MKHSQFTSCILVVQPDRACAWKIISMLAKSQPADRVHHAVDLTEAYNFSETMQPDLVLLDETHAQLSGLPMFLSLLSALAIDWLVITKERPLDRIPDRRQSTISEMPRFLKYEWAPRAALRHQLIKPPAPSNRQSPRQDKTAPVQTEGRSNVVVIGASTGGIEGLIDILSGYPAEGPPTVIVQHINPAFLSGLANRLDRLCASKVRPAEHDDVLQPGLVLLAPGDKKHLQISDTTKRCKLIQGPPRSGHRPSVDVLFSSAATALGARCVGVLLSGMGRDGASGLLEIRNQGGTTIAQDRETSIVYGMPRAAVQCGAVQELLPISKISSAVLKAASTNRRTPHDA